VTKFTVTVPATLSNLGPGYDVLGLAVELNNRFTFSVTEKKGQFEAGGAVISPKRHLSFRTLTDALKAFGGALPGGLSLEQEEFVPRSRGLGSSATARVAGLLAYLELTGHKVPIEEQVAFLAKAEGHPDNVTPALRGGLTLCGHENSVLRHMVLPAPSVQVALCIPDKTVETNAARKILPASYSIEDVVASTSRISFLMAGLMTGQHDVLNFADQDVIHQPYRKKLIGPVDAAFEAAKNAGALSAFISGSGSTLAAFVSNDQDAKPVAHAMAEAFTSSRCQTKVVRPSDAGARLES